MNIRTGILLFVTSVALPKVTFSLIIVASDE